MLTVSIITPLLNRASMLPDALASVAAQGVAVEHIVVDGGSTDGSQAIAAASGATVIDAPGTSIYEALNLGIARASGDIVCLLNSDDRIAEGAIHAAQEAFAADPALDLVRGRAQVERDGRTISESPGEAPTLRNILLDVPNINACFFRATLLRRVGTFNTSYPISADREWLARAALAGAKTQALDRLVYVYREHAASLTIGGGKQATPRWVREHIEWSRALLRDERLLGTDRAAVRAFHAKETAHLALLSAGRGAPLSAARALASGFRTDLLWPLHAAAPIAQVITRRARSR
jgi:glycosyltransferase involved in cell wall biosynthesis